MLSNLKNVFKVTDLRNKILFVMVMIALYRLGVAIRVPGIDPDAVKQFKKGVESQGALGFLDLFSGGAFGSFSIFALGIMPYITASIIMQVLGVVIPKLEKLQQEGAVGQRKITQYTRYLAIGISTMQATALTFIFGNGNGNAFFGAAQRLPKNVKLLPDGMWPRGYLVILSLVAGTAVLMWIGELISQRGIGNGMSMVIFASVVSRLPFGFFAILKEQKWFAFVLLVVVSLLIVVAVVRVELAQRRIPVQFAKRRPEHLHPVEGQPERRRADHLRQLRTVVAGADHQLPRQHACVATRRLTVAVTVSSVKTSAGCVDCSSEQPKHMVG